MRRIGRSTASSVGECQTHCPKPCSVGFTGTPIDKGFSRSTMRRFGSLIDSYTIPQSVADGATVPIHYEARLPELVDRGAGDFGQAVRDDVQRLPTGGADANAPPVREQGNGG